MKPYFQDNRITIYNGDACNMVELADESIQCVVTSPPYWGLRKYSGIPDLVWGGDDKCEHQWGIDTPPRRNRRNLDIVDPQSKQATNFASAYDATPKKQCSLCGAWQGQYGLEPTPDMYIEHTLEFLREIRRVLRKDGVVFWNIGDSYASGKGTCYNPGGGRGSFNAIAGRKSAGAYPLNRGNISDLKKSKLKPKDLSLVPFRVAIAAQEDGWWVRSVIIWAKSNPMPESVTDRPTQSHEYILMLTKSKNYYWDPEAVRSPVAPSTIGRGPVDFCGAKGRNYYPDESDPNFRKGSEQWGRTYDYTQSSNSGRNIRTIWEFPTQPFRGAHFAVFPEKLPELCIKAATPEAGCCSECGAPWERIIEKTGHINKREPAHVPNNTPTKTDSTGWRPMAKATNHWQPTCDCGAGIIPSLVLDPFAGSGVSLWVAKKLGRRAVGYDISSEYCQLSLEENKQAVLL